MKIVVINGTEKRGITYRLKELFLSPFQGRATVTEWYLPKDLPEFCRGCAGCVVRGESACKDAAFTGPIWSSIAEADLIVLTSPTYVFHATGAMKNFLDHFAPRWLPHRPDSRMFAKRAVVIAQALGGGVRSCCKDMADSLSWWGVSKIERFCCRLFEDISWERLSEKRRAAIGKRMARFSARLARVDYARPAKTSLSIKVKFKFCRMIQRAVHRNGPSADSRYWEENGWFGRKRPWKRR